MTTLSEQLKALALPQTRALLHRKSLLFESSEASKLTKETFYSLGVNGFEDLVKIDGQFLQFRDALFSLKAIDKERSIMDRSANDELNSTLRKFLLRLSPYFQLKSALKVLEWLVYRFHINEYNVADFMSCILPYHDTVVFVRCLQILNISDDDLMWSWLLPMQKNGIIVPKNVMIKRVFQSGSLLEFMHSTLCDCIEVFEDNCSRLQTWFAFYASSVASAIDSCALLSESFVSRLVTCITPGIRSDVEEYCLCSFVVLCCLAKKANLSSPVAINFLKNIVLKFNSATLYCGLQTAVLLCDTQQDRIAFPSRAIAKLVRKARTLEFIENLTKLESVANIDSFVRVLFDGLMETLKKNVRTSENAAAADSANLASFALRLVRALDFTPETAEILIRRSEEIFVDVRLFRASEAILEPFSELISVMYRRYPAVFDSVVESLTDSIDDDMQKIVADFVCLANRKLSEPLRGAGALCLSLAHPNSRVRKIAVARLFETLSENSESEIEVDCKNMILTCFEEDDLSVLEEFLKMLNPELISRFENDKLAAQFLSTTERIENSSLATEKKEKVRTLIFQKFSYVLPNSSYMRLQSLHYILSAVLLHESSELWSCMKNHALLKDFDIIRHFSGSLNNACSSEVLTQCLAKWVVTDEKCLGSRLDLLKPSSNDRSEFTVLSCCVFAQVLSLPDLSPAQRELVAKTYMNILAFTQPINNDYGLSKLTAIVNEEKIDVKLLLKLANECNYKCGTELILICQWILLKHWILPQEVAKNVTSSKLKHPWKEYVESDASTVLISCLSEIIGTFSHKSLKQVGLALLKRCIKTFMPSPELIIPWIFYCVCIAKRYELAYILLRSMSTGVTALNKDSLTDVLNNSNVFAALMMSLCCESQPVREAAIDCVAFLAERNCACNFTPTIKFLASRSEELRNDHTQLAAILRVHFASISNSQKSNNITTSGGETFTKRISHTRKRTQSLPLDFDAIEETITALFQLSIDEDTPIGVSISLLRALNQLHGSAILKLCIKRIPKLLSCLRENSIRSIVGSNSSELAELLLLLMHKFDSTIAAEINPSSEAYTILVEALSTLSVPELAHLRQVLLVVTPEFYHALPASVQQHIFEVLLRQHLQCSAELGGVAAEIKRTLGSLQLSAEVVLQQINVTAHANGSPGGSSPFKKKLRASVAVPEPKSHNKIDWKCISLVLEVMLINSSAERSDILLPPLMALLKNQLDMGGSKLDEYIVQLLLANVEAICSKYYNEGAKLSESSFNVELIVQAIRQCVSQKTHQHAFHLLTVASQLLQAHVLHHVLSIFTFMGSSLMRRDDSYSFDVIRRTTETVIPALVKASQKSSSVKRLDVQLVEILRVFVSAFPHIPEHRKLSLFQVLIDSASVQQQQNNTSEANTGFKQEALWILDSLLLEHSITKPRPLASEHHSKELVESETPESEFCLRLHQEFPAASQFYTLSKLLVYLHTFSEECFEKAEPSIPTIYDARVLSEKQIKVLMASTLVFIENALHSSQLVTLLTECAPTDYEAVEAVIGQFEEELIKYLHFATEASSTQSAVASDGEARFYKLLANKCEKCLQKLNLLLPISTCLKSVTRLLHHEDYVVRYRVLEILNARLLENPTPFTSLQVPQLLEICDFLNGSIPVSEDALKSLSHDSVVFTQLVLCCLKAMVRVLSRSNLEPFQTTFERVTSMLKHWKSCSFLLLGNAVACLGELIAALGSGLISAVSDFVPLLIDILASDELNDRANYLCSVSCLTCFQRLLSTLALFISPFVQDILEKMSLKWLDVQLSQSNKSQAEYRLEAIKDLLSAIPTRVFLPAFSHTFSVLSQSELKKEALNFSFQVLERHFKVTSVTDLSVNILQVTQLFLEAFDLQHSSIRELKSAGTTEETIVNAFIALTLRLSEVTFRQLLDQLVEWAFNDPKGKFQRMATCFSLFDRLAQQLRVVFALFSQVIVKASIKALDLLNFSNEGVEGGQLRKRAAHCVNVAIFSLFDCLSKCFGFGASNFLGDDRLPHLQESLLAQLENVKLNKYDDRIVSHLVPCLGSFASACARHNPDLLKKLNLQILLKTRSPLSKVRYSALLSIEEVYSKIGTELAPLLPESMPFLAELLEDECEEVEMQCRSVMALAEQQLGEPFEQYLQ